MFTSQDAIQKVKKNEMKALFYFDICKPYAAEKYLVRNLKKQTTSFLTYNLLVKIYHQKKDYSALIKVLNSGIRNTSNKSKYRKLKKQVMVSKLLHDIFNASAPVQSTDIN